ncbi:MAG: hydantoinase B/oxoprolinase family protein, partial [Opitutales bacterium]
PPEKDAPATTEASGKFPVFVRDELTPGRRIEGPALVPDSFGTLVIEAGWQAGVGDQLSLLLERISPRQTIDCPGQPTSGFAARELFSNRFLTLVDEMGAQLQRTALSTNVKERLDFSCALLDQRGRLVVNAPHVPVHLGALGMCVRKIVEKLPPEPGDVIVSNHPAYGGSHLPDVTVIAPVHDDDGDLFAFVANRAHHAEIGGIRPGSMSPEACNLAEEGVVIPPTRLFRGGASLVEEVARVFRQGPWPSRRPDENLADLLAQVAAIRGGSDSLVELAREHGAATLGEHMKFLRDRSSSICREFLAGYDHAELHAEEHLDDGSRIVARINIRDGRAIFDFTGTSPRHPANLNATAAIVGSAVVYVLRLLTEEDVPLNEGFLEPVEIVLPENSLLAPRFPEDPAQAPAVSGGNVEVSQRLVDALLCAFDRVACSQGTMNNVIFGDATLSHYETVAGGSGAGIGFAGSSGVQVHMTNTAITDPEILELRQPVRLVRFGIRKGSGGAGSWPGGDGVEREYLFEAPLSLSLLTQRRTDGPSGTAGGSAGDPGE